MFISKQRDIVIPQSEHQSLAGILAYHWGNDDFKLPLLNRNSFVLGVATHDRAFGFLDTDALGHISKARRDEQVECWLNTTYENAEVELVILLHVRRLLNSPDTQYLFKKLNQHIETLSADNDLDLSVFEQADTITDFCDTIAFDFAFETPVTRTLSVYMNESETADITYTLKNRAISLDKNPFSINEFEGYILGYQLKGYPDRLEPVLLEYKIN